MRRGPKDVRGPRHRLIVMWDYQTLGMPAMQVSDADSWVRTELNRRFGQTTHRLFKAFTHPSQSMAADELESRGWRVWENDRDIDEEIIDQARSDSGRTKEFPGSCPQSIGI